MNHQIVYVILYYAILQHKVSQICYYISNQHRRAK